MKNFLLECDQHAASVTVVTVDELRQTTSRDDGSVRAWIRGHTDRGQEVSFWHDEITSYPDGKIRLDYGYAITMASSQGMTVDRAFVLANQKPARETIYPAATRHRERLDFYIDRKPLEFEIREQRPEDQEGIDRDLLKTILVYLVGHNRPIAELLAPRRRDIAGLYDGEFRKMTREPVPLQTLLDARERLVAVLHAVLTEEDRAFLLSVKARKPDWSLIDLPGIADLSVVRWKLVNLDRMSEAKHAAALDRFSQVLGR